MLVSFLEGGEAAAASHAELERRVSLDGREVLRLALQGHLDLRASSEQRVEEVTDATGLPRGSVEAGHERVLATVLGEVTVARLAYRRRSCPNLHPADGALNLPAERYSHGLRELAAVEADRRSKVSAPVSEWTGPGASESAQRALLPAECASHGARNRRMR